jgi:predicted transcriptional regulator
MKLVSRKRYYTITEAAKELGITRAAVHHAIKQGRLEADRGEILRLVQTKTKGWKISPPSLNSYRVSLLHQWVGFPLPDGP